jgi:hypothetical protein
MARQRNVQSLHARGQGSSPPDPASGAGPLGRHLAAGAKVTFREKAGLIAKEQWILALMTVALSVAVWGFVREEGKGWTIATVMGAAGPWVALTGSVVANWFRITKGQKTDRTLSTIEMNVQRMLSDFDARMTDLVGKVTGGNSSPYLKLHPSSPNPFDGALVTVIGSHSLREVSLQVECTSPHQADLGMLEFGTIPFGHFRPLSSGPSLDRHDAFDFKLTFRALNGTTPQLVRLRKVDGQWRFATAVAGHGVIVHEDIQPGFPYQPDWEQEFQGARVELGGKPYNPLA